MLYGIVATVTTKSKGWMNSRRLPTFYLDSAVQGILSKDHAKQIATEIVNPTNCYRTEVDIFVFDATTHYSCTS